jgi:hypothetical protein
VNGTADAGKPRWHRRATDEEFLWLRLFAMVDEVEATLERLAATGGGNESTVVLLERLRADLVAALQLAADCGPPGPI